MSDERERCLNCERPMTERDYAAEDADGGYYCRRCVAKWSEDVKAEARKRALRDA